MLVVFPLICVADTKLINGYNFVASVNHGQEKYLLRQFFLYRIRFNLKEVLLN